MKDDLCVELESERLVLKKLTSECASEAYLSWINDPEVTYYLEIQVGSSMKDLQEFLRDVEQQNILFWAIYIKDGMKHIGNIKIDPISARYGYGEYGIMLGDKQEWGKGYAKEASQIVIDYCFSEAVNLRKMNLGVISTNKAAVKLYESMGFIKEGVFVDHMIRDEKYLDLYRYALFNPSFK